MHRIARAISLGLALTAWPAPESAPATGIGERARVEFVVVVNEANPIAEIDRETLSKIFLKRSTTWSSGKAIQPLDLLIGDASRAAFSRTVLRKSINAVRAYWQQQIFSGREVPPAEKSEADVLAGIKADPLTIGYISVSSPLPAGVKRLIVTGIDE